MKKQFTTPTSFFLVISTLIYFSCGRSHNSNNNNIQNQEEQQSTGDFQATIVPVNSAVINNVTSTNNFNITGNTLTAVMSVSGVSSNFMQKQNIHIGRACPSAADDINGDGFVDAVEAQNRSGGILIPLDNDLNTQDGGLNIYPQSGANGSYNYSEQASLSTMLQDLTAADNNPNDEVVKLAPGSVLNIDGATLELQGIPNTVNLPSSVAGLPGQTPHESFPVACGILRPVTGGGTSGGSTGGGGGGRLSCNVDIVIVCPQGQQDGCLTGETRTHTCVRQNEISCSHPAQLLCLPGLIDGCITGQTSTHRCVKPNAVSCMQDLQILCPTGFRDGCETGQTTTHTCVRQNPVACTEDQVIMCPPGFQDGCINGRTTTHMCVRENEISCNEPAQLLCIPGRHDGCNTGETTVHRCVRNQGPACTVDIAILCPTGFSDGCENGRTTTHQCVRNPNITTTP